MQAKFLLTNFEFRRTTKIVVELNSLCDLKPRRAHHENSADRAGPAITAGAALPKISRKVSFHPACTL